MHLVEASLTAVVLFCLTGLLQFSDDPRVFAGKKDFKLLSLFEDLEAGLAKKRTEQKTQLKIILLVRIREVSRNIAPTKQ
jgi:hypothetical protein